MSKRLVRIYPQNVFFKLEKAAGLEVNAVTQSGRTYFGKLISVTIDTLIIKDTRNHAHKLALSDLYEIVYDQDNDKTLLQP